MVLWKTTENYRTVITIDKNIELWKKNCGSIVNYTILAYSIFVRVKSYG